MTRVRLEQLLWLSIVIRVARCRCAYDVDENLMPYKVDKEAFPIGDITTQCIEYIGEGGMGCCNKFNDQNSKYSYRQIDGVFGSQGGACDMCAINLKRFWCEYACSDRQSDFMVTSEQLEPMPDPLNPGTTIMVQRVVLTVYGQTACDLYKSCERNPFVASVSAMGSPAGFLTFQGHNAVDNAHQYIQIVFSDDPSKSLILSNSTNKTKTGSLTPCNYTTNESIIHGFPFYSNCTCNACEQSCDNSDGFVYEESSVFEGFNYILVSSVYGSAIFVALAVTLYRHLAAKKSKRE